MKNYTKEEVRDALKRGRGGFGRHAADDDALKDWISTTLELYMKDNLNGDSWGTFVNSRELVVTFLEVMVDEGFPNKDYFDSAYEKLKPTSGLFYENYIKGLYLP